MATNASPPEFDFRTNCFFKSSFARTLSSNSCRSLDFEQNFYNNHSHFKTNMTKSGNGLEANKMVPPVVSNEIITGSNDIASMSAEHQQQQHQQQQRVSLSLIFNRGKHTTLLQQQQQQQFYHQQQTIWSRDMINDENFYKQNATKSTEIELKTNANQNHSKKLIDQHYEMTENTINVETVVLRNQVDTLQWQLKQVETSCDMYRGVMQEVARFLERYQTQRQQKRLNRNSLEQISRSKSLYQVNGNEMVNNSGDEAQSTAYLCTSRSSNNLMHSTRLPHATAQTDTEHNNSYNAFKDFTWRRLPKKTTARNAKPTLDDAEEKLSQEAFRLSRTIQNLLNTSIQQPDLTHRRNSLSTLTLGRLPKKPAGENSLPKGKHSLNGVVDILLMRSNTMRDSRLSVRSSTDSSVHSATSSSSSKAETPVESSVSSKQQIPVALATGACSNTEDESGFSSINSFQDVGVPALSSTLIERKPSLKVTMRPKSLCATKSTNIVGLPDTPPHVWDVQGVGNTSYHNTNKYQRFSTLSTEESATVLWV